MACYAAKTSCGKEPKETRKTILNGSQRTFKKILKNKQQNTWKTLQSKWRQKQESVAFSSEFSLSRFFVAENVKRT